MKKLTIDDLTPSPKNIKYINVPTHAIAMLKRFGIDTNKVISIDVYENEGITAILIKSKYGSNNRYNVVWDDNSTGFHTATYTSMAEAYGATAKILYVQPTSLKDYIVKGEPNGKTSTIISIG